jgi:hemerythrin-like domain-containing protein
MAARTRKQQQSASRTRKRSARKASPSRRRRQTRRPADALALLKDDHREVESLFSRFEKARGEAEKGRLGEKICNELDVHARIEEQLFYPAVREAIADDELMNEAEVEHASAKDLIGQIQASSPSDERYDALVKVLAEYVRHHVKEEEREMFPKARRSGVDLVELGEKLRERKREETKGGGGLGSIIFGRAAS